MNMEYTGIKNTEGEQGGGTRKGNAQCRMLEFDEALDEGCRLMLTATLSQARVLKLPRISGQFIADSG